MEIGKALVFSWIPAQVSTATGGVKYAYMFMRHL